jgi:endonuclease YncB( thermonuclease family)
MKTLMLLGSLVIAFASAQPSSAAPLAGKVVGVKAGDRLEILGNGEVITVRLRGIACPARGESFGKAARKAAAELSFMNDVSVDIVSAESDGSFLADVRLADGRSLAAELLRSGMAWWDAQGAAGAGDLAGLEQDARDGFLGLWATPEDEGDIDWRKEVLVRRESAKAVAGLLSASN